MASRTISEAAVRELLQIKIDALMDGCEAFRLKSAKSGAEFARQRDREAKIDVLQSVLSQLDLIPDAAGDDAPELLEVVEAMASFDGRNNNAALKTMAQRALAKAKEA